MSGGQRGANVWSGAGRQITRRIASPLQNKRCQGGFLALYSYYSNICRNIGLSVLAGPELPV